VRVSTSLGLFLDVGQNTIVVAVHVHACAEQSLLKVAVTFLLRQLDKLVQHLQALGLLLGVGKSFAERVQVPTAPVKIAVISLLKQVRYFLEDVDEVLGPAGAHQSANDVPRLDRSIVDHKLVLLLVLGLDADLDGPSDEGESVVDLLQVAITFQLLLGYLTFLRIKKMARLEKFKFKKRPFQNIRVGNRVGQLTGCFRRCIVTRLMIRVTYFDGRLSEESTAVELVLLVNSLEENVEDALGGVVTFLGEQRDFGQVHDHLG